MSYGVSKDEIKRKCSFQYLWMLFSPDGTTPMLATFMTLSVITMFLDDMVTEAEHSFIPWSFPVAVKKENRFVNFLSDFSIQTYLHII